MNIDNTPFVIRNQKQRYILVIALIIVVTFLALSDFFRQPVAGIPREIFIIAACCLYASITLFRYYRNYHFINFVMSEKNLTIRFYSLRNWGATRKSIEIPLSALVKYEIKKGFFKPELILYQRIQNKNAKYPPLSLSGLSKSEIAQIEHGLRTLLKK